MKKRPFEMSIYIAAIIVGVINIYMLNRLKNQKQQIPIFKITCWPVYKFDHVYSILEGPHVATLTEIIFSSDGKLSPVSDYCKGVETKIEIVPGKRVEDTHSSIEEDQGGWK